MTTLREKTIAGLKWSFADRFVSVGVQFTVGVVLARLLTPKDFGLVGMVTVFTVLGTTFVDSGFSQALIRKEKCSERDYSTVFYFNLLIGGAVYGLLILLAAPIARFYNEPELTGIVKAIGVIIIIESLTVIQRTILTKNINFKLQTKISVIASVLSGLTGITLALIGYGVWSLVWRTIIQYMLISLLLWRWNRWKPQWIFDSGSFREMFGFGSKLLASGLINTTFQNIYYLVIGKFFSAVDLGLYTKADQFKTLPSQNLDNVIQRVSYPVLAEIQNDNQRLKNAYRRLIKNTMFLSFVSMIGIAAIARPMVITLLGEKWSGTVPMLQLLCFSGMLYPLHSLNLNMLKVKGRSDLFLTLEIIKKALVVPAVVLGVLYGIETMLVCIVVNSFIAYYINSYWSGALIGYPVLEQVVDILPSFAVALAGAGAAWGLGLLMEGEPPVLVLCAEMFAALVATVGISWLSRLDVFFDLKEIWTEQLAKRSAAYASK